MSLKPSSSAVPLSLVSWPDSWGAVGSAAPELPVHQHRHAKNQTTELAEDEPVRPLRSF